MTKNHNGSSSIEAETEVALEVALEEGTEAALEEGTEVDLEAGSEGTEAVLEGETEADSVGEAALEGVTEAASEEATGAALEAGAVSVGLETNEWSDLGKTMAIRSHSSRPRRKAVPKPPPSLPANPSLDHSEVDSCVSKSVNSNETLGPRPTRPLSKSRRLKTTDGTLLAPGKMQEPPRFMINLEDLVLLEEKLCRVTDGLKVYKSNAYDFEEWWILTTGNTLSRVHTLFRDEHVRKHIREAMVLEVVSVALAEFCFLIGSPPSMMLTQVQNVMFYVHQNFLVVVSFLLSRLPTDNGANSWAQNLQLLIDAKRVKRAKRCDSNDLLRQNNEVISNIIKNVCRMNILRNTNQRARAYRLIVLAGLQVMRLIDSIPLEKVRNVMQQALDTIAFQGRDAAKPIRSAEDMNEEIELPHVEPPFLPPLIGDRYTLILDLDETLVHYTEDENSGQYQARPGLQEFLAELAPYYELSVFTAAMQEYADWVLDEIDTRQLIAHRLYRQHTIQAGNAFVKDLNLLGRDLARTIIIDNVGENFQLQPGNGILIRSWFDDMQDAALSELLPLLKGREYVEMAVKKVSDVRVALQTYREQMLKQMAQGVPHSQMSLRLE